MRTGTWGYDTARSRGDGGPLKWAVLAAAFAVAFQCRFLTVVFKTPRRAGAPRPVEAAPYDEIWTARQILKEERYLPDAVAWGESALQERGPDAALYTVIGEGYLRMGKADEARRNLFLATISPGEDADRARARDLLESIFR